MQEPGDDPVAPLHSSVSPTTLEHDDFYIPFDTGSGPSSTSSVDRSSNATPYRPPPAPVAADDLFDVEDFEPETQLHGVVAEAQQPIVSKSYGIPEATSTNIQDSIEGGALPAENAATATVDGTIYSAVVELNEENIEALARNALLTQLIPSVPQTEVSTAAPSKDAQIPYKRVPKEPWQVQKAALAEKFGEAQWAPRKRLSPDALEGIRALHAQYHDKFTTPILAEQFKVSLETIRRILRSKWKPNAEEEKDRLRRWDKRGERIWTNLVELGPKLPKKWRDMGIEKAEPGALPKWKKGSRRELDDGRRESYDGDRGAAWSRNASEESTDDVPWARSLADRIL
ncbi:hypothetical protein B0A49_11806 [Cryomyces minteri]|uniref:Required for respiratory growth protein 9, mitochondrial n=1 Tax=Cryomyces minteri TaxID=331657 RepID=A0A4U0VMQ2_9PEZI|nr:hypothetical protein B0A49_11806 [Cryomyces minteri]